MSAIIVLCLVIAIACGLMGCAEVAVRGCRYVRWQFKHWRWNDDNQRYMARWRKD